MSFPQMLNNPASQLLIEKALRGRMEFYHEQMPHMHRHGGKFSLSQITMDDVEFASVVAVWAAAISR